MRKQLRILSYIGLAIATMLMVFLFANGIPGGSHSASVALAKTFDEFPENEPQFVDFRLDELSFADLSEREKQDQLRDWLLFTIAADPSLTAKEINESLYDLSTTRHGYMRPVSNFEYGTTRSLYVGAGEVVALVPVDLETEERLDALAHIADKHRKDVGQRPSSLVVFEYELHPEEQYGLVTRREVLAADTLFTADAGYIETTISSLADFQQFMEQVDDLTYAEQRGEALLLGGRELQGQAYQGIRVEDVAAIWQSEAKIRRDFIAFETKWNAKLNQALPSEQAQIEQQAYQEMMALGLVNGSGFSLDPAYNFQAFGADFAEISPALEQYVATGNAVITSEDIQAAKTGLANGDEVPFLVLADKLKKSDELIVQELGYLLEAVSEFHSFQKARYDGDLQGTEVGMVLFYTDLLAKLWALNYQGSTPQDEIPDFAALPAISGQMASIYKQELEDFPNTRLWFGPQDKGFQIAADNRLLFARNATRVYAASSNPLNPGEETIASANSDAFLGWWNDHYEEVAAYEPQYERLNEIMKWSLLISWLNDANRGHYLSFLKDVAVQRDAWFPEWAKAQGDRLRFKDWESVQFYPRDYLGIKTEAMPILYSEPYTLFGDSRVLSGGVSLADETLFQSRKALSSIDNLDDVALRSTIDYNTLNTVDDQLSFSTLEGTAYRLFDDQPTLASVAAQAKEGIKLRGQVSELANRQFVRNVARTDDGLNIATYVDEVELGRLQIDRAGNGFDVGWLTRDFDDAQLLIKQAHQMGSQSLEGAIQAHPQVAAAAQIDDGSYLVKFQGADDWMQVASGGGGRDLPPDWHARIGNIPDDPSDLSNYLLRWVDDETVQQALNAGTTRQLVNRTPELPIALDPDNLIHHLKRGNHTRVAQQIADDPKKVHAIAREHIQQELQVIDTFRREGQTARALQHTDELIRLYGRQPDLMLQKALLDIDRRRLAAWRIDPNQPIPDPWLSQDDLFGAIGDVYGSADDGAHFNAWVTDDEVIYIQDSPGFNNLDPTNMPTDDAFPFGSEARVYRLESGSIGDAHIGGGGYDDPVGALIIGGDNPGGVAQNTLNLQNFSSNVPTGGLAGGDDECREETQDRRTACPRDVYVVIDETTL